jgi:hypothetical protein
MRQAAMAGDRSAARALLRLYGFDEIAREMKPGKPYSNRVRNAVNCLTAGTGVGDAPGPWEVVEADGTITNEIQFPPDVPRGRVRPEVFDD